MSGPSSSTVFATNSTPTPSQLAVLVRDTKQAGLYVSIRPLLDETALGISRVYWSPANPDASFASYRHFLIPYATMAQREHVQQFIVGAEFSMFADGGTGTHWIRPYGAGSAEHWAVRTTGVLSPSLAMEAVRRSHGTAARVCAKALTLTIPSTATSWLDGKGLTPSSPAGRWRPRSGSMP